MELRIAPLDTLPAAFERLRSASIAEGFSFLNRLADARRLRPRAWDAAACLLGAYVGGDVVAVGAQTADEYDPSPEHRRLRHFYVDAPWRRRGVGRALASALSEQAFAIAPKLHLRATTERANAFWEALGFERVEHPNRTHEKVRP